MAEDFTSFAAPTNINMQGHVGTVEYGGGPSNRVVRFYTRSVRNAAKSNETGRPFFEDKVYVIVHPPGERLNIVDRPATHDDAKLWPVQWAQFQQSREQIPEGTPIDMLYPDRPSIASMLKAHGVHTVEQCSELSGPAIDNIGMGAQQYCNDASKYLQMAQKGVGANVLRKELEQRDQQIRGLEHTIQLLRQEIDSVRLNANTMDKAQLQGMIAQAMERPVHMPSKSFDADTAMINATHPTADIVREQQKKAETQRRRERKRLSV